MDALCQLLLDVCVLILLFFLSFVLWTSRQVRLSFTRKAIVMVGFWILFARFTLDASLRIGGVSQGRPSIVVPYIYLAGNPNITDFEDDNTPLIVAAEDHKDNLVKFLLARGADPNIVGQVTALMVYVQDRNRPMVAYLLAHGADPNKKTRFGLSALQLAQGSPDLILQLKQAGAVE